MWGSPHGRLTASGRSGRRSPGAPCTNWYEACLGEKPEERKGSVAYAEVEERQLLKAMTWWDGFVVALANPAFLIAALGSSIGALGTTGAFVLWTISITFGALQNNIHA